MPKHYENEMVWLQWYWHIFNLGHKPGPLAYQWQVYLDFGLLRSTCFVGTFEQGRKRAGRSCCWHGGTNMHRHAQFRGFTSSLSQIRHSTASQDTVLRISLWYLVVSAETALTKWGPECQAISSAPRSMASLHVNRTFDACRPRCTNSIQFLWSKLIQAADVLETSWDFEFEETEMKSNCRVLTSRPNVTVNH